MKVKASVKPICPKCKTDMIAKCGQVRIHHWAHKNKIQCDDWMEDENEWRREWLSHFAPDCQEQLVEHNGQSHFADILTTLGSVILLHQSQLTEEMIREREAFYQTPVWIFNAGRYKQDVNRFLSAFEKNYVRYRSKNLITISEFNIDKVFKKAWLSAQFPVFFDFSNAQGTVKSLYSEKLNGIWCLLPYRIKGFRVLFHQSKEKVILKLKERGSVDAQMMKALEADFKKRHPKLIEY